MLDNLRWSSVEHYYQAQKFPQTDICDRIRNAATSLQARKIARNRSLLPRSDWSEIKELVMIKGVSAKFEQNRKLLKSLVATKTEILIHHSSQDLFWGQNDEGVGDNRLGQILMEVRQRLQ